MFCLWFENGAIWANITNCLHIIPIVLSEGRASYYWSLHLSPSPYSKPNSLLPWMGTTLGVAYGLFTLMYLCFFSIYHKNKLLNWIRWWLFDVLFHIESPLINADVLNNWNWSNIREFAVMCIKAITSQNYE